MDDGYMTRNDIAATVAKSRQVRRRWHQRTFSGCPTCRRRHVKCDERTPACSNCTRLGLECHDYAQKVMFKVYSGSPAARGSPNPVRRKPKQKARTLAESQPTTRELFDSSDSYEVVEEVVPRNHPGTAIVPCTPPVNRRTGLHFNLAMNTSITCIDSLYYSHFLSTVSTILIVWDAPYNSNPYRLSFPSLCQSSWSLSEAMKALGALHLANTSSGRDRNAHLKNAMSKYGEIVYALRRLLETVETQVTLADLATHLLLCLFEMMDAQTGNWRIHLQGARNIYEALFRHNSTADLMTGNTSACGFDTTHPIRPFLVSLLAYLDVAAACATGNGTLLPGNYWESHGGGWEYNLGVPSFSQGLLADSDVLAPIRSAWSSMMSIQADISAFAKAKRNGLSAERQLITQHALEGRLKRWREGAPQCFTLLEDLELIEEGEGDWHLFEAMGFVEAYEKASIIYLHRVTMSSRWQYPSVSGDISDAVDRILSLARKFCKGIVQLGMPWALFMAGLELMDECKQAFVRDKFTDMARFGMRVCYSLPSYLARCTN
ncbi:hypothetical protein BP6252_06762 [Coleophoma cylindrospora]|uniref:Zn(2)-C6 fungal-type domain-containing protein n=1 Tax=Coleophoma cylindrospora TaxID=1849047 RepID=A0A3D8RFM7_9HELO|nr:hypothetical protein BP6252_06762 [Coleophoma cylindrospora]